MSDDDFGTDNLAAYLHLTLAQVSRLAERGKLPGRKVGGQWRFSRAAVHHWLEERIGLSDDDELAEMEGFLRRGTQGTDASISSIAEMLPGEAIAIPLSARTRTSVIMSMVELAARTGWLWDPQKMAEAVRNREEMSSTALDNGVALLHPRRPMSSILGQPFLALGRTDNGIPFGNRRLTDIFFLVCSVDDKGHLQVLARLSRLIGSGELLGEIRAAPDPATVRDLIAAAEQRLV